eukprot:TRINITY_DN31207_c0_g1_i1.p1 TRINITY_DN31207_c0_g1~~TRINITY_DN31207_c0_g1_i1.p1  ORF type:complete len:582 (-),score=126.64 TRINITY_DN31207_c0_g1_i1:258-2003(-)
MADEATTVKAVFKEVREINRKSVFLDQASIEFPDGDENVLSMDVVLTPTSGYFRGGRVVFHLAIPPGFPKKAPLVKCKTMIFHPNISFCGNVCFSMFGGEGFSETYLVEQYINGLLWLLHNPNHDSALNSSAYEKNAKKYDRYVQQALRGLPVRGQSFQPAMDPAGLAAQTLSDRLAFVYEFVYEDYKKSGMKPVDKVEFAGLMKDNLTKCGAALPKCGFVEALEHAGHCRLLRETSRCSAAVDKTARRLMVQPTAVLKEIVWDVNGRAVITVSAGPRSIDVQKLAATLGVDAAQVKPMKRGEIAGRLGFHPKSVPSIGYTADQVPDVVIDESVFARPAMEEVVVAAGSPGWLLGLSAERFIAVANTRPTRRADIQGPVVTSTRKWNESADATATTTAEVALATENVLPCVKPPAPEALAAESMMPPQPAAATAGDLPPPMTETRAVETVLLRVPSPAPEASAVESMTPPQPVAATNDELPTPTTETPAVETALLRVSALAAASDDAPASMPRDPPLPTAQASAVVPTADQQGAGDVLTERFRGLLLSRPPAQPAQGEIDKIPNTKDRARTNTLKWRWATM